MTQTAPSKAAAYPAPDALKTPSDMKDEGIQKIVEAINPIIADAYAAYLKTKNFHWHLSGSHFRDYHLMFDEQAEQLLGSTDPLAERVRKLGGTTLRSISHIFSLQTVQDNNADFVTPLDMLRELMADNQSIAASMRAAHETCDDARDYATSSLLEVLIDETERRVWFLFEAAQGAENTR
ncbi:Dps family protein [Deinococcus marmoris]|uniref:Non-specific DNA-binding protein Dps / Iron-binding ferritin-like antioxidant protein / Ferroxidase n=1 Tax=Deinococcus marmoris TaxID=249408 RepID=A0A1U7NTH1_9DEIO|nr:DNA starvation/stationary phase protection protein [Deinococcus marmoris]OLV16223.1 Non-specific DNA-binding protein Dps / Iron-binding ferritin-like antioxidant protein / Ferroxidase [Deinococcus marmoris]